MFSIDDRTGKGKPLLLTFISIRELFDDHALLPELDLSSCIFDEFEETARKFLDAVGLPSLNRLGGNQFSTHTNGCGSRQDVVSRSLLIDAASSY